MFYRVSKLQIADYANHLPQASHLLKTKFYRKSEYSSIHVAIFYSQLHQTHSEKFRALQLDLALN